jgi:D-glycero-D-manno-heptose 1,7-bisphosphate phosphatase
MSEEDDDYHSFSALFLDRDGVINRRIPDAYVTEPSEFEFLPNVIEALQILSKKFNRIFIVTNQQGIGKGLMSEGDLDDIHASMLDTFEENEIRIDKIYVCPALKEDNDPCRKPNIGMALQAQEDFPDIDLENSVMVGDTTSDMRFGKNAGMKTVLTVPDNYSDENDSLIDEIHNGLYGYALEIE